ncbi:MAG: sulfurtransferase [Lysobacter sp.]|nr:MAG: sulfurtransferase [Lysobacter sp.]
MNGWRTLVDAETLAAQSPHADLVVFDCRFALADADAGQRAWREARIPGARYAHLDRDLSDFASPHREGSGRHPWPRADVFVGWLARNGVGVRTQVVAYDAGDGAFAARLWALLRALGHRDVAVLDGGWARWCALDLPIEGGEPSDASVEIASAKVPLSDAYSPSAATFDRLRLLDAAGVRDALSSGDVVIDARAAERFRGEVEPIDRVAGHVPGAINRPYAMNLENGRFKTPQALREEFESLLGAGGPGFGSGPERAIAMCGSGVTACHHLLVMEHAGLAGAALYAGSWSGWIEDASRPIATGDA